MSQDLGLETYRAILGQSAALQRILEGDQGLIASFADLADDVDEVLFTGCGSSHYLAMCAREAFRMLTGRRAAVTVASELFLYLRSVLQEARRPLLVALSRSGATTEVLRAVRSFHERHPGPEGTSLGVSCHAGSPLFAETTHGLALTHAAEAGLVMTQSFTAMLMALQLWAGAVGGSVGYTGELSGVDAAVGRVLDRHAGALREMASLLDVREWIFLAAGPLHGLACEGALKAREMAGQPAVAYHPLELRHGPMASVGPQSLVILLRSEAAADLETALVAEVRAPGAKLLVLSAGEGDLPCDVQVDVGACSDLARTLRFAPALQLLAYYRAMVTGRDPDHPPHLHPVVRI